MDAWLSRRRTPSRTRRDMLPALVLLALLAPTAARAQGAGSDTLTLVWTAPGDDGNVGTAASYEVRMSTSAITASNWGSASLISGPPSPLPAGTRQSFVVRGLTRGTTYYFAIKATDDASNVAPISNVVRWDWVFDTAPPAPPTGLSATRDVNGDVGLQWAANTEPDLAGYTVYRGLSAGGPFQALNTPSSLSPQYVDSSVPAGATAVWYQVSASDQSGNESGRSATYSLSLVSVATAWTLQAAYPNPSRVGSPVSIPLDVPTAGAGSAELQIVDSGSHVIRRLALAGLGGGPQTVTWDGLNEAGARVSPGVYTAWLVGGDSRRSTKLVRVP